MRCFHLFEVWPRSLEVESVAEPGVGRNWTEAKAEQDEKEVYIDWVKRGQPIDELFA